MSTNVLKAIAVAAELTRAELSPVSLKAMESDLSEYPEADVLNALTRCRRELDRPLTLKAILDRIHAADGRPSGDEVFAIAIRADDESETVVWPEEAVQAWAIAAPIFATRDKTGARVAFRDAYERLCAESRAANRPAKWVVSQGWDASKRESAVEAAVLAGYLPQSAARSLLPAPKDEGIVGRLLLGNATDEDRRANPEILMRWRSAASVLRSGPARETA